jgi:tetratricopeptide (TPR) repeat protein
MPNIPDYTELTKVVLIETGKYFALLLISVLAIRLWRRWVKVPAIHKPNSLLLAGVASLVAGGIGYASICHSMSLLYSHYGMKAFQAMRLAPALILFQTSANYWKSADAIGAEGVCLLWLDNSDDGIRLLDKAKAMRKGDSPPFEQFYEGLYYFFHDQTGQAVPLLEQASRDPAYDWNITKLFAVVQLDLNQPQMGAKLMEKFMQADITDTDQAYVMASLKQAAGKKDEALAIVNKFETPDIPPFWKSRFEKLRAQLQK